MKITYNGAHGPQIIAGDIPFTSGEPTDVTNEATAAALLAKPYFAKAGTGDQGPVTASTGPRADNPEKGKGA